MILIDANLLIYAVNAEAPRHSAARTWLESTLSDTTEVAIAWIVALAFLRITTRAGVFERPLPVEDSLAVMDGWLEQPFVHALAPGPNHWPLLRGLLSASGTAGNITADAHLAATALEYGCSVYSADYDFRRFAGITHVNPLAA